MIFETKTLIVVYKDELLMNQLKKLIETKDDTETGETVGVTDGSVQIVSWSENVWKDQKKAGNINNKVLFLGNVVDADKLLPIINVKYSEYGITYGWAGNQALLYVDPLKLKDKTLYNEFLQKLFEKPVPEQLKAVTEPEQSNTQNQRITFSRQDNISSLFGKAIKGAGDTFKTVSLFAKKTVSEIDSAIDDLPADRGLMMKQQGFYGIIKFYENDLEEFIQS